MSDRSVWLHALIAVFSITVGYSLLGSVFTGILLPYLIYMVLSQKAGFLPALALQVNTGGGIAAIVIFFSFIIVSILNLRKYDKKTRLLWIALACTFPIIIFLVLQRVFYLGETVQLALSYAGFMYFGLFAFFYGFVISKDLTRHILSVLVYSVIIIYVLSILSVIPYLRIVSFVPVFAFGAISAYISGFLRNKFVFFLSLLIAIHTVLNSEGSTFTNLAMVSFSFMIVRLYYKGKQRILFRMSGVLPIIIIVVLYYIGITTYMDIEVSRDVEGINITSIDDLLMRINFKLFGDRAPIWNGAFKQIIDNNSYFPVYNLSNIVFSSQSARNVEFDAGAHTTILEYLRRYGYIVGFLLSFIYFKMIGIARNVFYVSNLDPFLVVIIAAAISSSLFVALTGTFAVMTIYSIFTFGFLGIAYYQFLKNIL